MLTCTHVLLVCDVSQPETAECCILRIGAVVQVAAVNILIGHYLFLRVLTTVILESLFFFPNG